MEQQVVDFLAYLAQKQGRSANTIAAYRNDLTQFVEFLHELATPPVQNWRALHATSITAYVHFLNNGAPKQYSSATIARKLAATKRFCEFLATNGWIEQNFAKAVRLPKVTKNVPRAMESHEIDKLLAEPAKQHSPNALRDRALLETLYATGMRVSELVELDLAHVQLAEGVILCDANGKHSRSVKIEGSAATVLARYLSEARLDLVVDRNEPALFLNHRGQRLTRQGLWLIIKRYVKQIGIQAPITPHTLRHSFAAHLLNSGAALREIKERLGYANLSSTQVYRQLANSNAPELTIDGQPQPVLAQTGKSAHLNGNH